MRGHRGLRIALASTLILVVLALVLWVPPALRPRSSEEREVAARHLVSGVRISASVSRSALGASKALVDFLPENDVRLVLVRIVADLELEIHIETRGAVSLAEAPSFCLIGPFSAPDDAGYSSPCWGTPDIGELVAAQLPTDDAGHHMFPARPLDLSFTIHRGGLRCDYPPGRWLLVVEGDPLVDAAPGGARQFAEIGFDVPWSRGDVLPFLPVSTVAYCGLANVIYEEQGEPQLASPAL